MAARQTILRACVLTVYTGATVGLALNGCSSDSGAGSESVPPALSLGDAGSLGFVDAPEPSRAPRVDGGYAGPDGSVLRADRFASRVASVTYGDCAGFGLPSMPDVIFGPPVGGGSLAGSLDVVTLGARGEIILSFETNAIVDGPGVDFLVFENPFYAGGDPGRPVAELADVSVSNDGVTWKTFSCVPGPKPPYGTCAGWHPVYSAPGNGISPVDPAVAGGDPFDLADVGETRARFVRIRDLGTVPCPAGVAQKSTTVGFDLDAVALVHSERP